MDASRRADDKGLRRRGEQSDKEEYGKCLGRHGCFMRQMNEAIEGKDFWRYHRNRKNEIVISQENGEWGGAHDIKPSPHNRTKGMVESIVVVLVLIGLS